MTVFLILLGMAFCIDALNEGKALKAIIHGHEPAQPTNDKLVMVENLREELDDLYGDLYNEEVQESPSKEELKYISSKIFTRERIIEKLLQNLNNDNN